MATLVDAGYPNLVNILRSMGPDHQIAATDAAVLTRLCPLLEDIPWIEGNMGTGHLIVSDQALPAPSWRRLNEGLTDTKGATEKFTEGCGLLESHSTVDVDVAAVGGNPMLYRAKEKKRKIEGFKQLLETAYFYSSALTTPEAIHGLSARYAATSGFRASSYVLKPGTTAGSNARSVWLVNWSPDKLYGIYPRGGVPGIKHTPLPDGWAYPSSGGKFWAHQDRFTWQCGLAVEDFRHAVRFQWDPDDSTNFAASAKGLYLGMLNMLATIYSTDGNLRFYMDRVSYNLLTQQLASNDANFLSQVQMDGGVGPRLVPTFNSIPIRISDGLVAETAIS